MAHPEIFTKVISEAPLRPFPDCSISPLKNAPCPYASRSERAAYLRRIVNKEIPAFLLLSGTSGSGKSYVVDLLKDSHDAERYEALPRYTTRPPRAGDASPDIVWEPGQDPEATQMAIAYRKYGEMYGYSLPDLLKAHPSNSHPNTGQKLAVGKSIVIGDAGKFLPFIQAIELHLPLAPCISIRLDTTLDIAAHRMRNNRKEACPGEADTRSVVNELISTWESDQLRDIKSMHNLHTIINVSHDEIGLFGLDPSHLLPLNRKFLTERLSIFREESQKTSAYLANELLAVRNFCGLAIRGAPKSLQSTLETIAASANQLGFAISLKGGVAVGMYLNTVKQEHSHAPNKDLFARNRVLLNTCELDPRLIRPISPDIDIAIHSQDEIEKIELLFSEIGASTPTTITNSTKPIFKSVKFTSSVTSELGTTELDGIIESRINPKSCPFVFSFKNDQVIAFHARTATLGQGAATAYVLPPELLITEKLIARRGVELKKLDVLDAVMLIASQPLQISLFNHVIEAQRYSDIMYGDASEISHLVKHLGAQPKTRQAIVETLFLSPHMKELLRNRINQPGQDAHFETPIELTVDTLKKLSLIDHMLEGLRTCQLALGQNASALGVDEPLSALIGGEQARQKILNLQTALIHIARYQVGRNDVYIRSVT